MLPLGHDSLSHSRRMSDFVSTESLPFWVNIRVLKYEKIAEDWAELGESLVASKSWPESSWPSPVRIGMSKPIHSVAPFFEESLRLLSGFYRADGDRFGYDIAVIFLYARARPLGF